MIKQFFKYNQKTVLICLLSFLNIIYNGACIGQTSKQKGKTTLATSNKTNAADRVQVSVQSSYRSTPVYGFNAEMSKGPGLGNRQFSDQVASLFPQAIRIPGGTYSMFWDWKTGSAVKTSLNSEYQDIEGSERFQHIKGSPIKLSDVAEFYKKSHCDIVFVLNMITKTLEDQIEMLEHAEALGIPIKWVELGNEYNLQHNPGRKKIGGAKKYGETSHVWIKKIKKRFPHCKIALVGGNKSYSVDVKNWNQKVNEIAFNADALIAHMYVFPNHVTINNDLNFKLIYEKFDQNFQNQGFTNIKNKKIWITEYNILWSYKEYTKQLKNIRRNNDLMKTWSQTLATVLLTLQATFVSNNVELILNHSLANWSGFAAIDTDAGTLEILPNGIGMQILQKCALNTERVQKLDFFSSNKKYKDYELIGAKFSQNEKENFIVMNLTEHAFDLDISSLLKKSYTVSIFQNGKSRIINGLKDISKTEIEKDIQEVSLPLSIPPRSIITIN